MALEKTAGGGGNTVLQVYWVRKYSVQYYWDGKYSVQYYWDRKRLPANYFLFFRAYQKTGYPLTTNTIAVLYLFVNGYKIFNLKKHRKKTH